MSRKTREAHKKQVIHQQDQTFLQTMGITRSVIRPREEVDIQIREDRIGRYFRKYLNKFVFVEFSEEFMAESKAGDLMRGVPIPLRRKEVKEFAGGKGIDFLVLAENMAWVMGCDPHFKHTADYCAIMKKLYNYKIYEGMLRKGRDAAERGEMDTACVLFRATLCMKHDYLHGMYSYARACRVMYENSKNEEYIGRFKAEALEWFEILSETHPRFAMGYYYLGYSYLNMGLYGKAQLAWQNFLKFGKVAKDKREINKRLKQISDPVAIEDACLKIGLGRYEEGLMILESYTKSQFNEWWPLHFYLGRGYIQEGRMADAISEYKKVLQMNGSHLETMKELLAIYEEQGDKANIKKYAEKIKLIEKTQAEEQEKQLKQTLKENKKLEEQEPAPIENPESFDMTDADIYEPDLALQAAEVEERMEAEAAAEASEEDAASADQEAVAEQVPEASDWMSALNAASAVASENAVEADDAATEETDEADWMSALAKASKQAAQAQDAQAAGAGATSEDSDATGDEAEIRVGGKRLKKLGKKK